MIQLGQEVTSEGPPRRARASSRVPGLDAARVLATFGIVWVHTSEIQGQDPSLTTLGRFGTSFYILAAIFFSARSHITRPGTSTWDVARRRAKRLLVPYLLWCAIYAVFYFSTMYPQGYPVAQITRYWGPFFGTAPHLWFLPFAFLAGILASLLVPPLLRLQGPTLLIMAPLLTGALYVYVYGWGYAALDLKALAAAGIQRVDRWTEEAPLVLGAIFGVAIYGKYLRTLSRLGKKRRTRIAAIALIAFVITELAYAVFLDSLAVIFWNRVRFIANFAGACWLIAFVAARKNQWILRLAPLGKATYFAYLAHQLILDSVKTALKSVPGYGSMWFAFLSTVGIYGLAVGLGMLVSRVRILKWLSP